MAGSGLQDELEALRRELQVAPAAESAGEPPPDAASRTGDIRAEVERTLRELQTRLGEAADEAEDAIAANPFASVAAAFLLGVLVANLMSRGR